MLRALSVFAFFVWLSAGLAFGAAAAAEPVRIIAFGDSLTAGYGLPPTDAFPAKLAVALKRRGHDVVVVNAGVSGDTTSAGLARLDWSVGDGADAVILELGANDALRGIDPGETRKALDAIISRLKSRKIAVLIAGMLAPPNMGADYGLRFNGLFAELAQRHGALLYPFFLDGVAGKALLNQPDGLHPTAAGVERIVEQIVPSVEKLIVRAKTR